MKITKEEDFLNRLQDAMRFLNCTILGGKSIRVMKDVAQYFLLNNSSSIVGGTVYHYQIKDLGLGVCEVALAPRRYSTHLTKTFNFTNPMEDER